MPLRIAKSGSTIATFRIIDIDNDAFNFLTAAGITNTTQRNAINKLVIDLKYYGLWTKQKALYPVVGGTSAAHAVNLKTPGTYNLTFSNGWTHTSTGMTPASAYADTGLNTLTVLPQVNNAAYGLYSRTNRGPNDGFQMGNFQSGIGYNLFILKDTNGNIRNTINSTALMSYTNSDTTGFYQMSRISSTTILNSRNTIITNTTVNSTGTPNCNFYLGARNNMGTVDAYDSVQIAFFYISTNLTADEMTSMNNIVQQYQTNLGRQV